MHGWKLAGAANAQARTYPLCCCFNDHKEQHVLLPTVVQIQASNVDTRTNLHRNPTRRQIPEQENSQRHRNLIYNTERVDAVTVTVATLFPKHQLMHIARIDARSITSFYLPFCPDKVSTFHTQSHLDT
jgi:hypothetical protein